MVQAELLTIFSISDINKECLDQFRSHWQCLENHNQQLWNCRSEERRLNKCVFDKLVSGFLQAALFVLIRLVTGEEDPRHTKGRDTCPPEDKEHFCYPLVLYILPGIRQSRNLKFNLLASNPWIC